MFFSGKKAFVVKWVGLSWAGFREVLRIMMVLVVFVLLIPRANSALYFCKIRKWVLPWGVPVH